MNEIINTKRFMIWKYLLEIVSEQIIKIPDRSTFLSIQIQNDIPTMWLKVDPDQIQIDETIIMYGTGHEIKKEDFEFKTHFIGTVQQGPLVWHYYHKSHQSR